VTHFEPLAEKPDSPLFADENAPIEAYQNWYAVGMVESPPLSYVLREVMCDTRPPGDLRQPKTRIAALMRTRCQEGVVVWPSD
jgi:hypothetical protein